MDTTLRIFFYVAGGGALLAWISPRNGITQAVMILAWIGVCAVVDAVVEAARGAGKPVRARDRSRATSLRTQRAVRGWRGGRQTKSPDKSARHSLRLLHATVDLAEAEGLVAQLREGQLHPMLATHRQLNAIEYEVRLPESEWSRGRTVMSRLSARKAES